MKLKSNIARLLTGARLKRGLTFPTLLVALGAIQAVTAEPLTYNFVKFPPFQYQSEHQESQAEGVAIDLLRAASSEINLALLYQQLPRQRLIMAAATGHMQLALVTSLYIAPVRSRYLCSAKPLSHVKPTLYVNDKLHPKILRASDLTDEVVYAPYSTSSSLYKLLPATVVHNDSHKHTIVSNLFSKGRAGLVVNFNENMQTQLERSPPNFPYHSIELNALDIVLCISRSIENYDAIHASLELALLRVANSNIGQAIYQKHQFYLDVIAVPVKVATDSDTTI